jgi:hypothetical protein
VSESRTSPQQSLAIAQKVTWQSKQLQKQSEALERSTRVFRSVVAVLNGSHADGLSVVFIDETASEHRTPHDNACKQESLKRKVAPCIGTLHTRDERDCNTYASLNSRIRWAHVLRSTMAFQMISARRSFEPTSKSVSPRKCQYSESSSQPRKQASGICRAADLERAMRHTGCPC